MKKIVFLTGTRADYGKIKSLMREVDKSSKLELNIFATGMHMQSRYGSTYKEIIKDGFDSYFGFVNQQQGTSMDVALSNTILGFSNYVNELKPDMIVVHGDRLEALAGAIVGAFNNIKVAHIEGGEVSGTIDESTRHAVSKLAHLHFVANEKAKKRIIQLGENANAVFVIGSPDIDIMKQPLPPLEYVKSHYEIDFDEFAILMYHPVTTELDKLKKRTKIFFEAIKDSNENYVVVYPNNDSGNEIILEEIMKIKDHANFKVFPSIRFENFLTLMKYSKFMIGNSSSGIREAAIFGLPVVDVGTRQNGRYNLQKSLNIIHSPENIEQLLAAIEHVKELRLPPQEFFGDGNSDKRFIELLESDFIWSSDVQKRFVEVEYV